MGMVESSLLDHTSDVMDAYTLLRCWPPNCDRFKNHLVVLPHKMCILRLWGFRCMQVLSRHPFRHSPAHSFLTINISI